MFGEPEPALRWEGLKRFASSADAVSILVCFKPTFCSEPDRPVVEAAFAPYARALPIRDGCLCPRHDCCAISQRGGKIIPPLLVKRYLVPAAFAAEQNRSVISFGFSPSASKTCAATAISEEKSIAAVSTFSVIVGAFI